MAEANPPAPQHPTAPLRQTAQARNPKAIDDYSGPERGSPDGVDPLEKREPMEIRVARIDDLDAVLPHQDRGRVIVHQVSA